MWDEGLNTLEKACEYAISKGSFNKVNLVMSAQNVCVFGLGTYFKEAFVSKGVKERYKVTLLSDNDERKWGDEYEGLPCISPTKLKEYENLVVIIMMGNPLPVQRQLDQMGITWVTHVDLSIDDTMGTPTDLKWFKQEISNMKEAYSLFDDENSHKIYVNGICNRIAYPFANLSWQEMYTDGEYFSQSFMPLTNNEVFVDCGAYDGDTVLRFLQQTNGYREIHAFEMDKTNFDAMKKRLGDRSGLYMYCQGVWSENRTISYGCGSGSNEPRDGISIMKSKDGEELIAEVVRLDDVLGKKDVTFIKMDIEGAEMDALHGAKAIIAEKHPKLAICVYHKTSDFWNVPLFVKAVYPKYRLRLRHHYDKNCWGTVLYAC